MRTRLSVLSAAFAVIWIASPTVAGAQAPAALGGQVSSAKEGAMEGVVVSAKKAGGTVTVSVVSDAKGHYSFPASRL
jgi:virginiamycin B lyase